MPINASFDDWDKSINRNNAEINGVNMSIEDFGDCSFKCCTSNTNLITIQNENLRLEIRPFKFKIFINRVPLYPMLRDNYFKEFCKKHCLEESDGIDKFFEKMFAIQENINIHNIKDYPNRIGKIFNNRVFDIYGNGALEWYTLYIHNVDGNLHIIRHCDIPTNQECISLYQTLLSQQCVMSNPDLSPSARNLYNELENKLYVALHTKDLYDSNIDGQEILDELLKEFRETSDGFKYFGERGLAYMTEHVNTFADGLKKLGYEPSQQRLFIKGFPMLMYTKAKSARQPLLEST